MRRELFAAASVLVLMTGGAIAQTSTVPSDESSTTLSSPTHSGQLASAEQMLGKSVVGQDGNEIGEVEDVILDPTSGEARQLVISSGGFLGIGQKQIAVDFNQATWNQANEEVQLSGLTREDVGNMADFEYSDTMTSLNRSKSGTSTDSDLNRNAPVTTPSSPAIPDTGTTTTPTPE